MDVPQVMYDNKINQMMREFEGKCEQTGLNIRYLLQIYGNNKRRLERKL